MMIVLSIERIDTITIASMFHVEILFTSYYISNQYYFRIWMWKHVSLWFSHYL